MLSRARDLLLSLAPEALLRRALRTAPLVILGYHDLSEEQSPSSWLRVKVSLFREHLGRLGTIGRFAAPGDLDHADKLPRDRPNFLLTFDDGYANHLRLGLPILEEHAAPALFFVSTHHAETGEPFWFDRVVTPLQAAGVTLLDLRDFGLRRYRFRGADGGPRWDDIQRFLVDLKRLGDPGDSSVDRVLGHLDRQYGAAGAPYRERLRPLRLEELRQLAASPLCHIGGHGHRHEIFTRLDAAALAAALSRSREMLREVTGTAPDDIAYPNGNHDERVIRACRDAGFTRGYTAAVGAVGSGFDPMRIPRILVGGYDSADALLRRIRGVLVSESVRGAGRRRGD